MHLQNLKARRKKNVLADLLLCTDSLTLLQLYLLVIYRILIVHLIMSHLTFNYANRETISYHLTG